MRGRSGLAEETHILDILDIRETVLMQDYLHPGRDVTADFLHKYLYATPKEIQAEEWLRRLHDDVSRVEVMMDDTGVRAYCWSMLGEDGPEIRQLHGRPEDRDDEDADFERRLLSSALRWIDSTGEQRASTRVLSYDLRARAIFTEYGFKVAHGIFEAGVDMGTKFFFWKMYRDKKAQPKSVFLDSVRQ